MNRLLSTSIALLALSAAPGCDAPDAPSSEDGAARLAQACLDICTDDADCQRCDDGTGVLEVEAEAAEVVETVLGIEPTEAVEPAELELSASTPEHRNVVCDDRYEHVSGYQGLMSAATLVAYDPAVVCATHGGSGIVIQIQGCENGEAYAVMHRHPSGSYLYLSCDAA